MRRRLLTCLALIGAVAYPQAARQVQTPDGREFTVRIKPASASIQCLFNWMQYGPFGGYRHVETRNQGGGAFAIRTGLKGQPADTLKVAIWCRSYGMALLDIDLKYSNFDQTVTLTPLPEIPLPARLLDSDDGVCLVDATVQVMYRADWMCGFFKLWDCGVPQWDVATGKVGPDRTLTVMVPDLAHDPVVTKGAVTWREFAILDEFAAGVLSLRASRSTPPHDYSFVLDDTKPGVGDLRVAAEYKDIVLRPRKH